MGFHANMDPMTLCFAIRQSQRRYGIATQAGSTENPDERRSPARSQLQETRDPPRNHLGLVLGEADGAVDRDQVKARIR